ncbi:porin family protein [Spirosoma pollinicola]|uniref:Uncharacterized protein n=1 Tax=Spirosoma pollinicola TaxID=2057025 RepID=A0A2K8Z2L6_9BACT|nr:outer membrane beta-barrel protein [Spirosoma pollinicola]AUD04095.1 hypothetical protein CWM47_21030 [Spirosoma pollinicola]
MKTTLLFGTLILMLNAPSVAQSRFSLAPAYWFNYNPYSSKTTYTYNGSPTQILASGHSIISSFGLTARYRFNPRWDVSVGALYYRDANHNKSPLGPYGELAPFISKGWQLPLLVNFRLTDRRLSPYFSTGIIFARSNTFTARPVTTDGIVGVGLIYRFDAGLSLLVQPTASYGFYRPSSDAVYTLTQYSSYSLGLQTQLIWSF